MYLLFSYLVRRVARALNGAAEFAYEWHRVRYVGRMGLMIG